MQEETTTEFDTKAWIEKQKKDNEVQGEETNVRIRYGARDRGHTFTHKHGTVVHRGQAKNTLATIRVGKVVFFGVARCNKKFDVFKKSTGMQIATGRALKAEQEGAPIMFDEGFIFAGSDESTLRGYVSVDNIKELLNWFQALDTKKGRRVNWKSASERMQELAGLAEPPPLEEDFDEKEWFDSN